MRGLVIILCILSALALGAVAVDALKQRINTSPAQTENVEPEVVAPATPAGPTYTIIVSYNLPGGTTSKTFYTDKVSYSYGYIWFTNRVSGKMVVASNFVLFEN